jgi:hypothetical protein
VADVIQGIAAPRRPLVRLMLLSAACVGVLAGCGGSAGSAAGGPAVTPAAGGSVTDSGGVGGASSEAASASPSTSGTTSRGASTSGGEGGRIPAGCTGLSKADFDGLMGLKASISPYDDATLAAVKKPGQVSTSGCIAAEPPPNGDRTSHACTETVTTYNNAALAHGFYVDLIATNDIPLVPVRIGDESEVGTVDQLAWGGATVRSGTRVLVLICTSSAHLPIGGPDGFTADKLVAAARKATAALKDEPAG